jgi:hypothetical protein
MSDRPRFSNCIDSIDDLLSVNDRANLGGQEAIEVAARSHRQRRRAPGDPAPGDDPANSS